MTIETIWAITSLACSLALIWSIRTATRREQFNDDAWNRDGRLLDLAGDRVSPERKAMKTIQEAVLIGGPKCGAHERLDRPYMSMILVVDRSHAIVHEYTREDPERVVNGRIAFRHSNVVVMNQKGKVKG